MKPAGEHATAPFISDGKVVYETPASGADLTEIGRIQPGII
jgi:hypothetical protein